MEKTEPKLECLQITCSICDYGKKFEGITKKSTERFIKNCIRHFECRRRSPELVCKNEDDSTSWPMVKPTDFCGDARCKS